MYAIVASRPPECSFWWRLAGRAPVWSRMAIRGLVRTQMLIRADGPRRQIRGQGTLSSEVRGPAFFNAGETPDSRGDEPGDDEDPDDDVADVVEVDVSDRR